MKKLTLFFVFLIFQVNLVFGGSQSYEPQTRSQPFDKLENCLIANSGGGDSGGGKPRGKLFSKKAQRKRI